MAFVLVFFLANLALYLNNNDTCSVADPGFPSQKGATSYYFGLSPKICMKTIVQRLIGQLNSHKLNHFNNLQTINNGCYIAVTQKGCVNKYNQRNITSFVTSSCRLDSSCYGTVVLHYHGQTNKATQFLLGRRGKNGSNGLSMSTWTFQILTR